MAIGCLADGPPIRNLGGRPTIYTDELAKEICDTIANTAKGYLTLHKLYPHWPDRSTITAWRLNNPQFSAQYDSAKALQLENMQEEMYEIACDDTRDVVYGDDGKGTQMPVRVQRHKIMIETLRWNLERLAPKKYAQQTNLVMNPDGCLKLYDASVAPIPGGED